MKINVNFLIVRVRSTFLESPSPRTCTAEYLKAKDNRAEIVTSNNTIYYVYYHVFFLIQRRVILFYIAPNMGMINNEGRNNKKMKY